MSYLRLWMDMDGNLVYLGHFNINSEHLMNSIFTFTTLGLPQQVHVSMRLLLPWTHDSFEKASFDQYRLYDSGRCISKKSRMKTPL